MESAILLKENKQIEFLFIGYGSKIDFITETIEANNLENVKFLGPFPMEETSALVNICDVSLVTFTNIPILYTNSPNKLFDSLSAGKPIIVNSPGWTKKLVEDHECGVFVNPESPEDLVEKIKFLKDNPAILKKMGLNSRKLAENEFDKSILCEKFASVVNAVEV
jgi:glycosyltransferase involved in cell wall biosynthesis